MLIWNIFLVGCVKRRSFFKYVIFRATTNPDVFGRGDLKHLVGFLEGVFIERREVNRLAGNVV